ncbi:integrase catalytic domain-containing protein [Trichonephila clavata]|uniref:Integrase catalytic domain-containing protein n=1 Tax=Trichonephila clavata TaxID=2740835 RepID=A0A8X6EZG5_TRICU|nr:integrase catalytic domain-containing protein [Trichonephila clavata]
MANALQKQTDLSIPELQAKLDVVLKLQDKFETIEERLLRIANDTEYAESEPSLNSLEDDLQDFEVPEASYFAHKYSTPSTNYKTDLETLGPDLNSSQILSHSEPDSSSENARVSFHTNGNNSILINTAIVYVRDSEGIRQPLRAILDCASESSFISSRSAEALGLQKEKLWLLKLDWYEILPPDISQQWENFIKTLPDLEKIKVPRCFLKISAIGVVLHGFADASSKAYGAVVYMQTVSITEESNCQLLCKIASLKKGSSVPQSSKLRFLNPFIDREVLSQARDFHLGQQALLNTVRLKYWPLGGRSIARRVVHECVECFKE